RDKLQSPEEVVATVNQLVQDFGLSELPAIDSSRAKNMGIESLSGINIRKNWKEMNWNDDWVDNPAAMGETQVEDFQRKPYGEFDDWFGVERSPERKVNETNSSPGTQSNASTTKHDGFSRATKNEQKRKQARRRDMRMKNFQRFDFAGELPEKE
ncbi:MAG: hypothetical protein SGILL_007730, partial [Bacillariaceae sp.]